MHEARTRSLDPWIFHAIINRETGWTPDLVAHEHDGTCSVGLGQINGVCDESVMAPMRDPHANIQRMGQLFTLMRSICRHNCEDLGWLRAYNPGSPAYLAAIREAVKRHHAQNGQPVVLRVPTRVHVPGVLRQGADRAGRERRLDHGKHHP